MLMWTPHSADILGRAQPRHRLLPPPAARARSVAARDDAHVWVAGTTCARPTTHATTTGGRLYVVVAEDSAVSRRSVSAPRGDLPGTLVVTDLCPVRVRDRVRGTVWLTGWFSRVPDAEVREAGLTVAAVRPVECLLDIGSTARLLELHLHTVILADGAGTVEVPAAEYAAAAPDLLLPDEATVLRHLDEFHRDVLDELAQQLSPDVPTGRREVRPVALDSHGLTLRITAGQATRDARLRFEHPLQSADQLAVAMRALRAAYGTAGAAIEEASRHLGNQGSV